MNFFRTADTTDTTDTTIWKPGLNKALVTFRLQYEDDYEYEFEVLSTRTSKIFAHQT